MEKCFNQSSEKFRQVEVSLELLPHEIDPRWKFTITAQLCFVVGPSTKLKMSLQLWGHRHRFFPMICYRIGSWGRFFKNKVLELHWQFIKANVLDNTWNFSLVNLYTLAFTNRHCNSRTLFFKESASEFWLFTWCQNLGLFVTYLWSGLGNSFEPKACPKSPMIGAIAILISGVEADVEGWVSIGAGLPAETRHSSPDPILKRNFSVKLYSMLECDPSHCLKKVTWLTWLV